MMNEDILKSMTFAQVYAFLNAINIVFTVYTSYCDTNKSCNTIKFSHYTIFFNGEDNDSTITSIADY